MRTIKKQAKQTKRARVERDSRVAFKSTPKDSATVVVKDISRTGAFVVGEKPLPVGSTIDLKLMVQGSEFTLEGVGEVVRRDEGSDGMGVMFIMLTDDSLGALRNFIDRSAPAPIQK